MDGMTVAIVRTKPTVPTSRALHTDQTNAQAERAVQIELPSAIVSTTVAMVRTRLIAPPAPKTALSNETMGLALSFCFVAMEMMRVAMVRTRPTASTTPALQTGLSNALAECAWT